MSFLAPLFLLGLLGLGLPWLLHRLNEQDAPVRDFPSSRFLEPAKAISSRQKKLRYLLLLAARVLALLALCLLFAQPVLKLGLSEDQETDQIAAIVVDRSFSMRHGERWQRAMSQVDSILDTVPNGTAMQLFVADSGLEKIGAQTVNKADITSQLGALEPGFGGFGYDHLMRWIDNWSEQQTKSVNVHLVTDTQASAMPPRINDLIARHVSSIKLYKVGLSSDINYRVSAEVESDEAREFTIKARVQGPPATGASVNSVSVVLEQGNTLIATETVELNERGIGSTAFPNLRRPQGNKLDQYRLRLAEDDLLPDDDVDLVPISALTEARIRFVDEQLSSRAGDRVEYLFLSTALSLDKRNRLEFGSLDSTGIAPGVDVVIYVDDVKPETDTDGTSLLPELPKALTAFLDQGGNVVYIINAAAELKTRNAVVATVDADHGIGLDIDEWSDVSLYAQRPVLTDGRHSVLLGSSEGFPLLIEQSGSKGRLLWLNASLNGEDNGLPVSPVFVPFLQGLMDYFLRFEAYPSRLSIGESIKLKSRAQIVDPDGKKLLDLVDTADATSQVLDTPGIYTILDRQNEHTLVVSTSAAESDVLLSDQNALDRWEQSAVSQASSETQGSENSSSEGVSTVTSGDTQDQVPTRALFGYLIPLCLLLMFIEAIVANRHLRVRRAS